MSIGTMVIDERWRLPIQSVRLRGGEFIYETESVTDDPPPPGLARYQVVILGEDCTEITRMRAEIDFSGITPGSPWGYSQPIRVLETKGTSPW